MRPLTRALIWTLLLSLANCMGLKHLSEDETLLTRQKVIYQEKLAKNEMNALLKQRPNRFFFLFPWVSYGALHAYGLRHFSAEKYRRRIAKKSHRLRRREHKKKSEVARARLSRRRHQQVMTYERRMREGNLWMRLGEPMAVYDSLKAARGALLLHSYLMTEGYLDGEVAIQLRHKKSKKTQLRYVLAEGTRYQLRHFRYQIRDPVMRALIVNEHENASHIETNVPYQQATMEQERERLYGLLRNNGYYALDKNALFYVLDTLRDLHAVDAYLRIEPETPQARKRYAIESVSISIAPDRNENTYATHHDSIQYVLPNRFKSWALSPFNHIRPNALYSAHNQKETLAQFQNLNLFRFIDVSEDTLFDGSLHARIQMQTQKRFDFSVEGGMTSYIPYGEGPQLPSPFVIASLKLRNVFHALGILDLSARFTLEALATRIGQSPYQNYEVGLRFDWSYPHIKLYRSRARRPIIPRGRIRLGADVVNRLEYNRMRLYQAYVINWRRPRALSTEWSVFDLSLIRSELSPSFLNQIQSRFAANQRSILSAFDNALVSRSVFAISWNKNYFQQQAQTAQFAQFQAELSGLTAFLYSDLLNRYGLAHYRSFKFWGEYKHRLGFGARNRLVGRIKAGILTPYGPHSSVAYESYFFSGGSNSIRGWRPRRLGPGSRPVGTSSLVERTGELILETNLEWRAKLSKSIESALFLDAGNVWLVTKRAALLDNDLFRFPRFAKEIALTAGTGMRFHFSFLIFRLDLGFKVHDPSLPPGKRFVLRDLSWQKLLGSSEQMLLNIGIGHPF